MAKVSLSLKQNEIVKWDSLNYFAFNDEQKIVLYKRFLLTTERFVSSVLLTNISSLTYVGETGHKGRKYTALWTHSNVPMTHFS